MDHEKVVTFVSVTGASESVAAAKLQAHGGDLNAAINSYFNEGENPLPQMQGSERLGVDWMDEDEDMPQQLMPIGFPQQPSAPAVSTRAPRFPSRGTPPFVSQPRDVREISIDWRDDVESRARPHESILIEEVQDTGDLPLQGQDHNVIVDDEDTPRVASMPRPRGEAAGRSHTYSLGNFLPANSNPMGPSISEFTHLTNTDEEESLRAAIEASRKEAEEAMRRAIPEFSEGLEGSRSDGRSLHLEEDADIALAVSLSLQTAEQEKARREREGCAEASGKDTQLHEDHEHPSKNGDRNNFLKRRGSTSNRGENVKVTTGISSDPPLSDAPLSGGPSEESDELDEQPLLRRRSGRRSSSTSRPGIDSELPAAYEESNEASMDVDDIGSSAPLQRNGHVLQRDSWGGLSSEEQEESVMLEAAMFGSLPENALRFHYPGVHGMGGGSDALLEDEIAGRNLSRPAPLPPSPTVIAQRLLREQQDDEYLASLEADREKEMKAQRDEEARFLKEAEEKAAAHAEEQLRQEEEMRKQLAEKELKRETEAKRASLPKEPPIDDENAVTLMVRMPDGSRQGRRFQKSDILQSLFDFIDVSCGIVPGSYRLVRQYPRKTFTDAEHKSSFRDLQLTSRNEALFLEQM